MSQIQQFFAGRSIFITGFTGFLGKLVVSKILTSCPDIEFIYILIRKKSYHDVHDRLTRILESKVFSKLKEGNSDFHEKLVPLEGDVREPDLGLNAEDKETLINQTSIVIHLAQVSNCDANLKDALEVNVNGTRYVFELAKQMKQLVSLVHLSSVYSNCNHPTISEMIYQPAYHPNKLLGASEWLSDAVFKDIEGYLMKGFANSFTYTKSLSEFIIQEQFSDLPVSIVRPAIIGSTWHEPFQDWIDSNTGVVPILIASGKGYLRVLKGNPKSTAELIPADCVVNTLIATAWYRTLLVDEMGTSLVRVYNVTNNANRRLTWQFLEQIVCSSFRKNPLNSVIRIPEASMTNNRLYESRLEHWLEAQVMDSSLVYTVKNGLFHVLPAYGADIINLLLGRSPCYVTTMDKFLKLLNSIQFFTCRDWKIDNSNYKELMSKLSSVDKKMFGIDTSCTHWPTYIEGLCMGVKQHVVQESLSDLPAARVSINRIRWSNRFWNVVIFLIIIRLASTRLQWAKKIWTVILKLALYIYGKIPKMATMGSQ